MEVETTFFIKNRKGDNKQMFLLENKRTLCHSWRIFQRIHETAKKRDSGIVKSIRIGGIGRLKENCS